MIVSPTGNKTLLQSFITIFKKGNSIIVPKKCINKAGVAKIPNKFPNTALASADATFPFALPVNNTALHYLSTLFLS